MNFEVDYKTKEEQKEKFDSCAFISVSLMLLGFWKLCELILIVLPSLIKGGICNV